jgi:hypothetical protein
MIKLKSKITNPMTIIAIFATLSEASAAVSLPFLDDEERALYIWFLISFPFYLLFLFFATLNFNYRSLYAPSDFEKGEDFLTVMKSAGRKDNTPSPPNLPARHYVCLPERLKDLHIVDARLTGQPLAFSSLLESIQLPQKNLAQVIVFLTCADSETSLKESVLKHSKLTKKRSGSIFCVAFNSSSQALTIIGQTFYPAETGR